MNAANLEGNGSIQSFKGQEFDFDLNEDGQISEEEQANIDAFKAKPGLDTLMGVTSKVRVDEAGAETSDRGAAYWQDALNTHNLNGEPKQEDFDITSPEGQMEFEIQLAKHNKHASFLRTVIDSYHQADQKAIGMWARLGPSFAV